MGSMLINNRLDGDARQSDGEASLTAKSGPKLQSKIFHISVRPLSLNGTDIVKKNLMNEILFIEANN